MKAEGPKPPVTKWSFSALQNFEKCPYMIYLKRVDKQPAPPRDESHPAERGDRVHGEGEAYVSKDGQMTKGLQKFEDEFDELKALYAEDLVEVEQNWGFTREWATTHWNDDDCWAMIKCDAVVHSEDRKSLRVIDYKTGKRFGKEVPHQQQLQLYALTAFMRYPDVDYIQSELWYLDEGKTMKRKYDRSMVPSMLPLWEKRANTMTNAMVFKPKPNRGKCRYCDFGVENGTGVCAYAVPYDG